MRRSLWFAVWRWFDGRKRTIAASVGVVLAWVQAENLISDTTAVTCASLLTLWTGVALVHKAYKGSM